MIEHPHIVSNHIFMFPFTISKEQNNDNFMQEICRCIEKTQKSNGFPLWKKKGFDFESEKGQEEELQRDNLKYSEFFYFHSFVRKGIFSRQKNEITNEEQENLMSYYDCNLGQDALFKVYLYDQVEPFCLTIRNISLRIFETEIGILSFELDNYDYNTFDQILKINDLGRRIYPQFLDRNTGIEGTKKADCLPEKIEISFEGFCSIEDFKNTSEKSFKKDDPVVADYINQLLGPSFTSDKKRSEQNSELFLYLPTIDDRMYVVCWYGSDYWSKYLTKEIDNDKDRFYFQNSDEWYKFIFQDSSTITCPNPKMKRDLIDKCTYARWAGKDSHTLFGLTRYSLVCCSQQTDFFAYKILRQHMRKQYAQIAVILLAQRASILKFSEQVFQRSSEIKRLESNVNAEQLKDISTKVGRLHASYIRFVNRLWFTEVTPQEQGIEMYQQAVDNMRLKYDMDDLQKEIKELYEFVNLSHGRYESQQIKTLTVLGSLFLPITMVASLLGMNLWFLDTDWFLEFFPRWAANGISIVVLFILILGSYCLMRRYIKDLEKHPGAEIIKYISFKKLYKVILGKE